MDFLNGDWNLEEKRPTLASIWAQGVELKRGDQVRLCPSGRADIFDLALAGRIATIDSIEQDYEDRIHLSVTINDDPGKDLGSQGKPGHRFFFRPDEVELVGTGEAE